MKTPYLLIITCATSLSLAVCGGQTTTPPQPHPQNKDLAQTEISAVQKRSESGDPAAMIELVNRLGYGRGINQNPAEAIKWLRKAADMGDPDAIIGLGLAYQYPDGRGADGVVILPAFGLPKDPKQAITLFRKAADAGSAGGMFNLGLAYETEKNIQEAKYWFLKAASTGDASALNKLGVRYATGQLFEKSQAEAEKCFLKTAQQGEVEGMSNLGTLYAQKGDMTAAVKWLEKAGDAGSVSAMENLAIIHMDHYGASINAMKWMHKAADAGSSKAKAWLAQHSGL